MSMEAQVFSIETPQYFIENQWLMGVLNTKYKSTAFFRMYMKW